MERRSCAAGTVETSWPATVMVPELGSTMRLIMRREVVLPHPEGPTRTVMAPLSMDMVRLSTAGWPPLYRLVTLWNSIMASAIPWPIFGGQSSPSVASATDDVSDATYSVMNRQCSAFASFAALCCALLGLIVPVSFRGALSPVCRHHLLMPFALIGPPGCGIVFPVEGRQFALQFERS